MNNEDDVLRRYWHWPEAVDMYEISQNVVSYMGGIVNMIDCRGRVLIVFRLYLPLLTEGPKLKADINQWTFSNDTAQVSGQALLDQEVDDLVEYTDDSVDTWKIDSSNPIVSIDSGKYYMPVEIEAGNNYLVAPYADFIMKLEEKNDALFSALADGVREIWKLTGIKSMETKLS